jgi:hypothetical protein
LVKVAVINGNLHQGCICVVSQLKRYFPPASKALPI